MPFVPDRPSTRVPRTEPLKRLLAERGIALKKRWGQHFCLDQNLLDFIARTADIGKEDVVLEVGCGLGHLTRVLSPLAGRLVGVEVDHGLAEILRERLADLENLDLVEGDILAPGEVLAPAVAASVREAMDLSGLGGRLLVASNLPYAVAATVVVALLESGLPVARMVVMMQKEVAERMAAGPGASAYGLTSVLVQAKAGVHLKRRVPPAVFWPRPKVPSEIVVITPRGDALSGEAYLRVKGLAKALFLHRRKTLAACLRLTGGGERLAPRLAACGIPPGRRVDELDLAALRCLTGS